MEHRNQIGLILPVRPLDLDDDLPVDLVQNHVDLAVDSGCQAHSIKIRGRRLVATLLDRLFEPLLLIESEDVHHRRIKQLIRLGPDQLTGVGTGVGDAAILQIGGNQRSMGLNSAGQVQLLTRAIGQRLRPKPALSCVVHSQTIECRP